MLNLLTHRNSIKPMIRHKAKNNQITRVYNKCDGYYELVITGCKYPSVVLINENHIDFVKQKNWIPTKTNIVFYCTKTKLNMSLSKYLYGTVNTILSKKINQSDISVYDYRSASVRKTKLGHYRFPGHSAKPITNTSGKANVFISDGRWRAVIRNVESGKCVNRTFTHKKFENPYATACEMYDQMLYLYNSLITDNGEIDFELFRYRVRLLIPKTKF